MFLSFVNDKLLLKFIVKKYRIYFAFNKAEISITKLYQNIYHLGKKIKLRLMKPDYEKKVENSVHEKIKHGP